MTKSLSPTFTPKNTAAWTAWLRKNHAKKKEIWLVYYKRHTDKPTVEYRESLEEALRYGWIDTTLRTVDKNRYARRFTPRSKASQWSTLNIRIAKRLMKEKKMKAPGLRVFKNKKTYPRTDLSVVVRQKHIPMPADLRTALNKNAKAKKHFASYRPSFQRIAIGWIVSSKQPVTRKRRIQNVVRNAAQHSKPSYS